MKKVPALRRGEASPAPRALVTKALRAAPSRFPTSSAGGRVYVYDFTEEDRVALTALNLRSGAVERVFDRGVVYRKADAPAKTEKNADWRTWANDGFGWGMVLVCDGRVVQMVRNRLVVMDASSGEVLWRMDAKPDTQYLKALVSGGRLVTVTAKVGVAPKQGPWPTRSGELIAAEAWDWKTGAPLWRSDLAGLAYPAGSHEVLFHQNVAAQEPYILLPHTKGLMLLKTADGARVWDKPIGTMIGYHIIGDRIRRVLRGQAGPAASGRPAVEPGRRPRPDGRVRTAGRGREERPGAVLGAPGGHVQFLVHDQLPLEPAHPPVARLRVDPHAAGHGRRPDPPVARAREPARGLARGPRGVEPDLEPYRQRKNTGDDQGVARLKKGIVSDGRAQMNDLLQLREGQLCLHDVPMVDVSAPSNTVVDARALVPPQVEP